MHPENISVVQLNDLMLAVKQDWDSYMDGYYSWLAPAVTYGKPGVAESTPHFTGFINHGTFTTMILVLPIFRLDSQRDFETAYNFKAVLERKYSNYGIVIHLHEVEND